MPFGCLAADPNRTRTEMFCQTLPIGCLSYRNSNFEIKVGGNRARLEASAPCIYAIIPYNIT